MLTKYCMFSGDRKNFKNNLKDREKIKRGMGLLSFSDVASLSIDCLLKYPDYGKKHHPRQELKR